MNQITDQSYFLEYKLVQRLSVFFDFWSTPVKFMMIA